MLFKDGLLSRHQRKTNLDTKVYVKTSWRLGKWCLWFSSLQVLTCFVLQVLQHPSILFLLSSVGFQATSINEPLFVFERTEMRTVFHLLQSMSLLLAIANLYVMESNWEPLWTCMSRTLVFCVLLSSRLLTNTSGLCVQADFQTDRVSNPNILGNGLIHHGTVLFFGSSIFLNAWRSVAVAMSRVKPCLCVCWETLAFLGKLIHYGTWLVRCVGLVKSASIMCESRWGSLGCSFWSNLQAGLWTQTIFRTVFCVSVA